MTATQEYSVIYMGQIADQEQKRLDGYKLAWKYYHGDHKPALKVAPDKPNDNLVLNMYAYIIDKGVSFLFGKEVGFQIEEGQETAEEQYLTQFWNANKRMSFLQDVALNGANCGHCFVEISPREGDVPRLINLDPAIVKPTWDPDDISRVLSYRIEYPCIDPATGKPIYKKREIVLQENGFWQISKYVKKGGETQWTQDGAPIAWDYPFAPIVDWKNLPAPNEFYGRPDVERIDGQDAINFNFSNSQKVYRYHGHPKTVGKGFKANAVEISPDEMIVLPDAASDVWNLEMQGDLNAAREDRKMLVTTFLQVNHVPNLGDVDAAEAATSGVALKVRYADLLARTETKRLLYGDGIAEIDRRALFLAGYEKAAPTKQIWQSPLPDNPVEMTDVLIKQIDSGITSKETAQQELGRDPETEKARIEAERAAGDSVGAQLLRAFNAGSGVGVNEQEPNQ